MTITVSPEIEKRLRQRAQSEGISIEAYVERLVREDEEWGEISETPLEPGDPEFTDIRTAVMEGLEQAKRGEGRSAEDVFAEFRAKHGILR